MRGIGALLAYADLRGLQQPRVLSREIVTGMDGAHAMRAFDSQAVKNRLEPASQGNGRAMAHRII